MHGGIHGWAGVNTPTRGRVEAGRLRERRPCPFESRKAGLTPNVQQPVWTLRVLPRLPVLSKLWREAVPDDRACRRYFAQESGCSVARSVGSDMNVPKMGRSAATSLRWRSRYAGREPNPSRRFQSSISAVLPGQITGSAITAVGEPFLSSEPVIVAKQSERLDLTDPLSGQRAGPVPNLSSVVGEAKDEMTGVVCGVSYGASDRGGLRFQPTLGCLLYSGTSRTGGSVMKRAQHA